MWAVCRICIHNMPKMCPFCPGYDCFVNETVFIGHVCYCTWYGIHVAWITIVSLTMKTLYLFVKVYNVKPSLYEKVK